MLASTTRFASTSCRIVFGWAWLAAGSAGAATPSIADLFRAREVMRAALSPDGKHVVLVNGSPSDELRIFTTDSASSRTLRVAPRDPSTPTSVSPGVINAQWVGPSRLLLSFNYATLSTGIYSSRPEITMSVAAFEQLRFHIPRNFSGYAAVDLTGKRWVTLPGIAQRSATFPSSVESTFTWDARRIFIPPGETDLVIVPAHDGPPGEHPYVARLNTADGTVARVVANPGRVTDWLFERTGRGALGVEATGSTTKLLGVRKPGETWSEIADLGEPRNRLRFHSYDASRGLVYVSRPNAAGFWQIAAFKLKEGQWTPPFAENARYDLTPTAHRPFYAGIDLSEPLFSPKTGLPLALSFIAGTPRQHAAYARLKAVLEHMASAEPDLTTFVIGIDNAETHALTLSWSARQPGIYSLVELSTLKVTRVAESAPWLPSAELAEMRPTTFKARDGVELDAYLTMPPQSASGPLPLVVLVRDHPWARDLGSFHPVVQSLALRGCAVLQVNHRGSTGYGPAFAEAGRRDPTGVLLDDLIDAVRWAIDSGKADPQRVAIVGASFGGTSALLAAARAPELFRCAAAIDAVSDWREIHRQDATPAHRYWFLATDMFPGDKSAERLTRASPISMVERLSMPLFLAHAEADSRSPIRHTKALAAALKKTGRAPETFYHNAALSDREATGKKRAETYERLGTFLVRHLHARPASAGDPDTKPRSH